MFNFCTKTMKKRYLCFCIYFSRNAIEQLRKDHEESIIRLKTAKDSQIEGIIECILGTHTIKSSCKYHRMYTRETYH